MPLFDLVCNEGLVPAETLAPYQHLDSYALWPVLLNTCNLEEEQLLKLVSETQQLALNPDYISDPTLSSPEKDVSLIYETQDKVVIGLSNPFHPIINETINGKSVMPVLYSSQNICSQAPVLSTQDEWLSLIRHAKESSATDIHIQNHENGADVVFRIDGDLHTLKHMNKSEASSFIKFIKLTAHMDISTTQVPQDGRVEEEGVELRISSLPTLYGEDIVCRLLENTHNAVSTLSDCGFLDSMQAQIKRALALPSGLILVTGATGSGKTTTLYRLLDSLKQNKNRQIITLEDPIESHIDGVRQSQINTKSGYDFKTGLSAILRQDPDCIMVGEIRDKDSAKMALDAAYTGHLVLASLHTNDVASTLTRLSSFDLDPFMIENTLKLVLSQKLVKKRCTICESGCLDCHHSGYSGRLVLAESWSVATPSSPEQKLSFSDDQQKKIELGWI